MGSLFYYIYQGFTKKCSCFTFLNLVTSTHLNVMRQISSKSKLSILEKYPRFCKYIFFTLTGARTKSEVMYILSSIVCLWVTGQSVGRVQYIIFLKNNLHKFSKIAQIVILRKENLDFLEKIWFYMKSSNVNFMGKVQMLIL